MLMLLLLLVSEAYSWLTALPVGIQHISKLWDSAQ